MKDSDSKSDYPEFQLIAARLKELRKEKGYTNYEHIAFELGMSRSAYWRLETGVNFELKTLIKVCRLLNVSLTEFFSEMDTSHTDKN